MAKKTYDFENKQLKQAVDRSLPWLSQWKSFVMSLERDIMAFEALLREKEIPMPAWIEVDGHGFIGWDHRGDKTMRLLFRPGVEAEHKPEPLVDAELEVKVMVFPYLSELSYHLCARIKLATTARSRLDRFAEDYLQESPRRGEAAREGEEAPTRVAKYA